MPEHSATQSTATQIERVARGAYARLLAWLAYQWRDVAAAEDALADALVQALTHWPQTGIPERPEAWLLQVAKRELLQDARRHRLHQSPEVQALLDNELEALSTPAVPDARLKLLFVCAHPAIDASIRPALMLQTVLGLDAREVAQAMLTSPSAMAQRLVRAKQKIRDAQLRFEEPDLDELSARIHDVLEALYAAYGLGWDAVGAELSGESLLRGMRDEALYLSALTCELMPTEPEVLGLQALLLFCEARVGARFSPDGQFVPLDRQDTARWNGASIVKADELLRHAATMNRIGPFQLEAAIQSAYCQRLHAETPWQAIITLYQHLLDIAPSLGATVSYATLLTRVGELNQALQVLENLEHPQRDTYQPYWVARAFGHRMRGEASLAEAALQRAIGLTSVPAVREHLLATLAELS